MNASRDIRIQGIPDSVPEPTAAVCRSRLLTAVNKMIYETGLDNIRITLGDSSSF